MLSEEGIVGFNQFVEVAGEGRKYPLLSMGDVAETVNDCASRLPAPALRPFIERYLGYRLEGFPAGFHKGVPSSRMPFLWTRKIGIFVPSLLG